MRRRGALGYRLLWFDDKQPEEWPQDSVAAISTHDLPTVAGIWKRTEPDQRQHHLRARLVEVTGMRDDAQPVDVAVAAYRRLGNAPSRIVLATLEDALGVEERPNIPPPERHIDASVPGEKVGIDCFYVGRLAGTKGTVWQYTAIDIASGFAWAELHTSDRNPRSQHCQRLVHSLAAELKAAGWKLQEVISHNGSEFTSRQFTEAVESHQARHRRIRAGRPTSNGNVERLQQTILEECWRPSFARSLVPKLTALRLDLADYLNTYNYDRAHTGRLTKGRVPADIVYGARKTRTVR